MRFVGEDWTASVQEALRDRKDAVAEASSTVETVIDQEKAAVRLSAEARPKELAPETDLVAAGAGQANADAEIR